MKKVLLALSFIFSISVMNAQENSSQESNQSETKNTQESEKRELPSWGVKAGYSSVSVDLGGLSLSVDGFYAGLMGEFSLTDKIILQPEALYSRANEANIIHVAAMAKYYVLEDLSIMAGPQATYFIGDEDVNDESFGIDLAIGAGFDITDQIFVDAKYAFGLNNRGGEEDWFQYKINTFQIGLGYRF